MPAQSGPHRAARRFLGAYLAYEIGDRAASPEIRATATRSLARQILSRRPVSRTRPRRAAVRIISLSLAPVPDRRDLVLATGTASRSSGPEPFAFLFARRDSRWRAVAPAE